MRILPAIMLLSVLLLQLISVAYAWEIERPGDDFNIKEREESRYTNGEASVGLGVAIDDYDEASGYGGADCLEMNISMTANSRKGIMYDFSPLPSKWWIDETQLWYRRDIAGLGDDAGVWVDIPQTQILGPFAFRFFGGLGSAEYKKVWICSNGWIGFDPYNSTSKSPSTVSPTRPNSIIAAVWTDLRVDGSATIYAGLYQVYTGIPPEFYKLYFVVIWKNILHVASQRRLTFEIILENAPQYSPYQRRYGQSNVSISYDQVSSINTNFACGIEDQEGYKGWIFLEEGYELQYYDDHTLCFYQGPQTKSFFLKRLTLTFGDSNQNTRFRIDRDPQFLRGNNVELKSTPTPEPDLNYMFLKALFGTGSLLLGGAGGIILEGVTVAGSVLVASDWVTFLAYYQYSNVEYLDLKDQFGESPIPQGAYIKVPTFEFPYSGESYMVDAQLDVVVHWILDTPNDAGSQSRHSLTITASLEYYEYWYGIVTSKSLNTTVNLQIGPDDNDTFDTADPIQKSVVYSRLYIGGYDAEDFYSIYIPSGKLFFVRADADSSHGLDMPDFEIRVIDPNGTERASSPHGYHHWIQHVAEVGGYWRIKACKFQNHGFYSLEVTLSTGGCPTLFVWNGSDFVDEGVLNIHSEPDVDVTLNHTLATIPARQSFVYTLKLSEIAYGYNFSHSYIDQVKLYTTDNNGVTRQHLLVYASHSRYGNVLWQLLLSDDTRIETLKGDEITLKFFAPPWINPKTFTFQIEGHNPWKT